MKQEEFEVITNSIKEKLGEENTALISDDLGLLITNNANTFNTLTSKDNEIAKLKEDKEKLIQANGNLLQRVSMDNDLTSNNKKETEKSNFSFRSCLDEKGNFKKEM